MEDAALSNRELAGLIWLGVVAAYVLHQPSKRKLVSGVGALFRTLSTPKLLLPILLYFGWLAGGIWLAHHIGLWNSGLLKPTLIWVLFTGIGLCFGAMKALRQKGFFKSALIAALGASAFVEFYVSFHSFPLLVELLAQPVVTLAVVTLMWAERNPEHESVVKVANWITAAFVFAAVVWVGWNLVSKWNGIDVGMVAMELVMPLWLTPIALSFAYALALYAGYEQAFIRIHWKAGGRSTWRLKIAFVSAVGVSLERLRLLHGVVQMRIAGESTFRGARHAIADALQE